MMFDNTGKSRIKKIEENRVKHQEQRVNHWESLLLIEELSDLLFVLGVWLCFLLFSLSVICQCYHWYQSTDLVSWDPRFQTLHMKTKSMARNSEDWEQEREEMRIRLELAEALAKKHEEQITEIVAWFGQNRDRDRKGGPILEGIDSSDGHLEDTNRREKWRKLEIPIFAGEDLFGWTHRVERDRKSVV